MTKEDLHAALVHELGRAFKNHGDAILEAINVAGAEFEHLADEARDKMPEALPGVRLAPLAEELRHSAVLALAASYAQRLRARAVDEGRRLR